MSNIITKAHPVPDMHSTGLRVVGAWLFAIVLILFSTVFVHVPYTREIQMVLAIPVLLFFGAPFYAGAWKGTRSGRNNIDRLVALTTSVAFLFSVFNTFFPDYWLGIGLEPHVYYGVAAVIIAFSLTGEFMEERARRTVSAGIPRGGGGPAGWEAGSITQPAYCRRSNALTTVLPSFLSRSFSSFPC